MIDVFVNKRLLFFRVVKTDVFCKVYKKNNTELLVFRVVKTKERNFRTLSSQFLNEITKQLKRKVQLDFAKKQR